MVTLGPTAQATLVSVIYKWAWIYVSLQTFLHDLHCIVHEVCHHLKTKLSWNDPMKLQNLSSFLLKRISFCCKISHLHDQLLHIRWAENLTWSAIFIWHWVLGGRLNMAVQDSRKCLVSSSLTCSQIGFFPLVDGWWHHHTKLKEKKRERILIWVLLVYIQRSQLHS
jgi:hypothetical protein